MDLGNSYSIIEGQLVSDKIERVVLAIKEYEPRIEVKWCPDRGRDRSVPAFKIIYHDESGHDFTLFHVMTEEEFDVRVLQKIIANDQRNGKASLSEFEAWEEAQRAVQKQKSLDDLEATADIVASVLKTNKNDYRVSRDIRIKEGIPFNVAHRKDY
jgi:ribosomal protein S7